MSDIERIAKAAVQYRANSNRALRASGQEVRYDAMQMPSADNGILFDGVDATADELISYFRYQTHIERSRSAMLTRTALTGLATEIGMHEVRTSLMNLDNLIKKIGNHAKNAVDSRSVEQASLHIEELDRAFGFLSRFRSGLQSWPKGSDIESVVTEYFARAISSNRLVIEVTDAFRTHHSDVPADRIHSVIINLIMNAYYWASRDSDGTGKAARVRLDAYDVVLDPVDPSSDDEYLRNPQVSTVISIEDDGPGIPMEDKDKIFRPFVSGRRSSGIGLYLCRANLEAHGRSIILDESGDLGGARFLIGRRNALGIAEAPDLDHREKLAASAVNIACLYADGFEQEVFDLSETYAEIQREVLRIKLRGPSDQKDIELSQVADLMSGIIEGRIDPEELKPHRGPRLYP